MSGRSQHAKRRRLKRWLAAAVAVVAVLTPPHASQTPPALTAGPPPFGAWLEALIDEAAGTGLDRQLVEETLADVRPLMRVIEADRQQRQQDSTLDHYLARRLTPELIARGRDMMRDHRVLLQRIERQFGVEGPFVVSIWGAETGYGRYTGDIPVFSALATLAWEPRRAAYFRSELFDALRMVDGGFIGPRVMVGSWAGAMGQPQFMPSSYLEYAVDFDDDRRRDIWTSVPDTLASIANYLRAFGWRSGEKWGREVAITPGLRRRLDPAITTRTSGCPAVRSLSERRPLVEWTAAGIRQTDGSRLLRSDIHASLFILDGRAFLVHRDYEAILGYNCSHRYGLSVAMLADQIR
jgi:membrane-bound lytic murein transglycosylase B